MACDCLCKLAAMSNKYGADAAFVLAGGGNTSFKNENTLFIKGSGTALATIRPEEFVRMDRAQLGAMWDKKYPEAEAEREAAVLADMMDAREMGEVRRPSVETLLHELFPQKYVLHVHPALVNGITCSAEGEAAMKRLFPDAVWIPATRPGYILAITCRTAAKAYADAHNGQFPSVLFLQNHGIFFAADTTEEIDKIAAGVMDTLKAQLKRDVDFGEAAFDIDRAVAIAPALRMIRNKGGNAFVRFVCNNDVLAFDPETKSFTPDHIVYYKAKLLILENDVDTADIPAKYEAFVAENGYKPSIVYVRGLGAFACGDTLKAAMTAETVFLDAVKISVYAQSFGGVCTMTDDLIDFIVNWEVENYRSSVSLASQKAGRLDGKVALVTGAAQGFGLGIAENLASEGACVVIADMNYDGAVAAAATLKNAFAVAVNVTDEDSVKTMFDKTVLYYGGLDVLVNNAGVAKAGNLEEMTKKTFEFVTAVNYTGYYLCVKYASRVMKTQRRFSDTRVLDIIEINSKSGLTGSNKNFAYAGSKFGGIGLTQSFALELVEFGIKVNAVCPGNFLNGPLWSDPEKGLFVQYLNAGKVPGAKTVADVRKFYESKVPMGRGCEIIDVVRAIYYIIEQEYETGQAIPVTGGQEMLK